MPLPTSLVVKNGSKIFSITSGGMPVPVSDDLDHHVVGRRHAAARRAAPPPAAGTLRGADRELAAVRHGVAGIDREVHHHLLELVHVGLDGPQVAAVAEVELDPLAEQALQQHRQVGEPVVEVRAPPGAGSGGARRRAAGARGSRPGSRSA